MKTKARFKDKPCKSKGCDVIIKNSKRIYCSHACYNSRSNASKKYFDVAKGVAW